MTVKSAAGPALRLAIVGPTTLVGQSLRAYFTTLPDFNLAWTAATTADAIGRLDADPPDVLLLDADLKEGRPMELAARIVTDSYSTRIVVIKSQVCIATIQWALKWKVSGYLLKDDSPETVIAGIKRALARGHCWSAAIAQRLTFNAGTNSYQLSEGDPAERLTPRQTEIITHLAQGASAKEVARYLHLAEKSINSHTYRIMKQLDIHDRVELTRFAIREGLIVP